MGPFRGKTSWCGPTFKSFALAISSYSVIILKAMRLSAWSERLTPMRDAIGRDPIVWSLTLIMAVIYLALAGRYDTFRNELYFIVCGRHPAFGYVDLPPLVPLIAAATQFAGDSTWLLRLPAIAAARSDTSDSDPVPDSGWKRDRGMDGGACGGNCADADRNPGDPFHPDFRAVTLDAVRLFDRPRGDRR